MLKELRVLHLLRFKIWSAIVKGLGPDTVSDTEVIFLCNRSQATSSLVSWRVHYSRGAESMFTSTTANDLSHLPISRSKFSDGPVCWVQVMRVSTGRVRRLEAVTWHQKEDKSKLHADILCRWNSSASSRVPFSSCSEVSHAPRNL